MHWPLKLSTSAVPGEVRRASEPEFMRSHEYMGGEVEIQVDDTVLVVHWGAEAVEGVHHAQWLHPCAYGL